QRLLDVEAVLRLGPDDRPRAVEDLGGDLFARMSRQAVHHERAGRREREQRLVDAVGPEISEPALALVLLSHRDPGVGDHDVGARYGLARIADRVDPGG